MPQGQAAPPVFAWLEKISEVPWIRPLAKPARAVLKGTFLGDIFVVSFGNGLARSFAFFSSLFLARFLGPSSFADFSIFFTLAVLCSQFFGGFDNSFVRFYAADRSPSSIRANLIIKAASGALILLIGGLFLSPISAYLKFNGNRVFVFLALLTGVGIHFMALPLSYFQAKERYSLFSGFLALPQIIFLALVLCFGLATGRKDFQLYSLLYLASFLAAAVISLGLMFKRGTLTGDGDVRKDLSRIFHFGKWLVLSSLLYSFYQRIDLLILSHFADKANVGFYSAAVRIASLVQVFTGAVPIISNPKASRLMSYQDVRKYLAKSFKTALVMTAPLLLLIMLRTPIVRIMLGKPYLPAAAPFAILSLGLIVIMFTSPLLFVFYAIDKPQFIFYKAAALSVALPALSYVLIPRLSTIGAALAVLLTYSLGAVLTVVMIASQWNKTIKKLGENEGPRT